MSGFLNRQRGPGVLSCAPYALGVFRVERTPPPQEQARWIGVGLTRRGDERAPYSANGATWYPVAEGRLPTRVLTLFGILWAPDDPNQVISCRFRLTPSTARAAASAPDSSR